MRDDRNIKIILLQMPWADISRPSIALGILTSLCNEAKVSVKSLYPNLDLASCIGHKIAVLFSDDRMLYGLSEHLFAVDIFGKTKLQSDEYLKRFSELILKGDNPENLRRYPMDLKYLKSLRDEIIPEFLETLTKRVIAESPTVVGFTATYNQTMSSLSLANRIKKSGKDIKIIAGGASFHGVMGKEYHKAFHSILDNVFLGEAENSFREYLRRTKAGETFHDISGISSYIEGTGIYSTPDTPLEDLNLSPIPNYDDYFFEINRLLKDSEEIIYNESIPFESSRGCWWGCKSHCIFCGINENTIKYRSKDTDRIIKEILLLSSRYRNNVLTATDNIMPKEQCNDILKHLIDLNLDLIIFYEVRPNLSKEQIKSMKEAGISSVQPGIESLSTSLLRLIKKGTTAINQVQFLRWCKEMDINALYNILRCVPKDKKEYYLEMVDLIPRLHHLQPPNSDLAPIEMHRFSPIYENMDKYGIKDFDVRDDYYFNIPEELIDLSKIAYFFTYNSTELTPLNEYELELKTKINTWKSLHSSNKLPIYTYFIGPGYTRIIDTRTEEKRIFTVKDIYQDIILLCDEIMTKESLLKDLAFRKDIDNVLDPIIQELLDADILLKEGNLLLTLPIGHKPRTTEQLRSYVQKINTK